ncbi:hypothetical protein FRB98_007814 [Tulasnella sp. 332]|nr:hypothetical protein FRB98_007814 [Tulasnella sp. 332]
MEIGKLAFSRSGKVIVGHGLLLSEPSTPYSLDLSRWLMRHFWHLTNEVLYGDADPIDDQNWYSMQNKREKHVHALETLVAYDCPNFVFMTKRLTDILTRLDGLQKCSGRHLSYSDIRTQLLRAPGVDLCFFYYPPDPMEVSLGDIGHINADSSSFVRLANIGDNVPFTTVSDESLEYVTASPPHHLSEQVDGDIMRHTFYNPIHASVVRQGEACHIKEIVSLWPHFIRRAPRLAGEALKAGVTPEDLILITAVVNGRQATRLEFKPDNQQSDLTTPFRAEFIEHLHSSDGANWGTWIVSGTEVKGPTGKRETDWTVTPTGHCVKMRISRYQQRIEFMQMSRSDYAPIDST